jgi:DNA repair photolyase
MVLLRLPGEVREIFREWLLRHYPDRVKHVLSLVRETRGGKDYNSAWGERMTGEGAYATLMQQRFARARERFGLDRKLPALRTDLFTPPRAEEAQLELF